jgi:tetratricopeptide (TPR) repeat protein
MKQKIRLFSLLFLLNVVALSIVGQTECRCDGLFGWQQEVNALKASGRIDSAKTIISKMVQEEGCEAYAKDLLAAIFIQEGNYSLAFSELQSEKSILDSMGCADTAYIYYHATYGKYLAYADNYDEALDNLYNCLELADKTNNHEIGVFGRLSVSFILSEFGEQEKAMEYTRAAIDLLPELKDQALKLGYLSNISGYYITNFSKTNDPANLDTSSLFINEMIELAEASENYSSLAQGYVNLLFIRNIEGDINAAINYSDTALYYSKTYALYPQVITTYSSRVNIFMQQGREADALGEADSMIHYAELMGNLRYQAIAWQVNYEVSKHFGKYESALKAFESMYSINDSLQSLEKQTIIAELEEKYQAEKNEATIKELTQEKQIISLRNKVLFIGILFAALVIVLIVFIGRQRSFKDKQLALEAEQRLNRARMDPHFMFNALSSLQASAMNGNGEMASHLSKFAMIMRQNLESTYREFNTLEKETDFLLKYLELQKMRTPDKFDYFLNVDELEDPSALYIPTMLVQPFIENAIEHGFYGLGNKGRLDIVFTETDKTLNIRIEDNGVGLHDGKREKRHISRATQIIRDRLYLLKKKYKGEAFFTLKEKTESSGVIVDITLPIILQDEATDY